MEKKNTSIRLKEIMSERNLKQVDILNMVEPYCKKYGVKMNKSDLSQYCSGKTSPNQDKLHMLSLALDVNESWLMGYNVPIKRESQKIRIPSVNSDGTLGTYIEIEDTAYKTEQNDKNSSYYIDKDAREMANFLATNPEYKVLFDASRKVKKEDIEKAMMALNIFKEDE